MCYRARQQRFTCAWWPVQEHALEMNVHLSQILVASGELEDEFSTDVVPDNGVECV